MKRKNAIALIMTRFPKMVPLISGRYPYNLYLPPERPCREQLALGDTFPDLVQHAKCPLKIAARQA